MVFSCYCVDDLVQFSPISHTHLSHYIVPNLLSTQFAFSYDPDLTNFQLSPSKNEFTMPKDSRIKFKIGKTEWHAGILRKELPEDERKNLAIGVSWGQDGFEKAIELYVLFWTPFSFLQ